MDENMSNFARAGNGNDLYSLIRIDGNVLKHYDEVEFVSTPLHLAAEEGCTDFAMEIMSLKPSFAWKLNQEGLSPIHIAAKNRNKAMVLRLLGINKDLARVRGKKGRTPLHYICEKENLDGLLERFLQVAGPECIRDVTTDIQTALHIAVENNRLDVLRVLIRKIRNTEYCHEVVNRKDKDGNTALHIAASKNQAQMLKPLLQCKADIYATNEVGLTARDVAHQHNNNESIGVLRGCFNIPGVSTFEYKLKKQILMYVTKASSVIFHDMDNISSEDRNALLVILGLLLTATFQASLSPPGGVWQGDGSSQGKVTGKSVLSQDTFLFFYIPIYFVFIVTFFLILGLLKPFPLGFRTALEVLLAFLAICFDQSILYIAPTKSEILVLSMISTLYFILMVFMSIAYGLSKISVSILGCWFPLYFIERLAGKTPAHVLLGCVLFVFLHDEFKRGTILAIAYGLVEGIGYQDFVSAFIVVGCWLFLSLCRFCIKRFYERTFENFT